MFCQTSNIEEKFRRGFIARYEMLLIARIKSLLMQVRVNKILLRSQSHKTSRFEVKTSAT